MQEMGSEGNGNCNAIEDQFVMLLHMHRGLPSPSAHIITSALLTSTKTEISRKRTTYYVGSIINSNPSHSLSELPKEMWWTGV